MVKAVDEFDVLIIGAGQAGIPLARRLAAAMKRVAIAERRHLGGSCVNFGCTPSKAVIASARVAHLARRASEFGVNVSEVSVDFSAVLKRAKSIVGESVASLEKGLAECGVTILRSHARFAGRDGAHFFVSVGDRQVRAKHVVIDTGTRTAVPPIEGLDEIDYLHAGNWLHREDLPEHVIFIGAGVITLEMAQFYRRMGSDVLVIGAGPQVADREDADVAQAIQKILKVEGIRFVLNAKVKFVKRQGDGVYVKTDAAEFTGSHLFVATGRQPNTDELGLKTIRLKPRKDGTLSVNDRLETDVVGVWAAGDVRGGPMFTHTSWDDHRVLESQFVGDGSLTIKDRIVPYAIFTDPELGRVGMTESQARQAHGDHVKVATFEMKSNGKASEIGEPAGFIKLIADTRTGNLLGVAVLAVDGAELVGSYITLMNSHSSLAAICKGVYIHPTLTEAVQSAVMALDLNLRS